MKSYLFVLALGLFLILCVNATPASAQIRNPGAVKITQRPSPLRAFRNDPLFALDGAQFIAVFDGALGTIPNGAVTRGEFFAVIRLRHPGISQLQMQQFFNLYDINRDNIISAAD